MMLITKKTHAKFIYKCLNITIPDFPLISLAFKLRALIKVKVSTELEG